LNGHKEALNEIRSILNEHASSINTLTGKIEDLAHKISDLNIQTQRILLERKADKEEFLRLLQTRIGDAEEWKRQAERVSQAWQELLSIEQGFYSKISLFHRVEDRIGEIIRVLQSHEIRLAGCEESTRQLGQQPLLSTDTEPDVHEGRTYSNEFGESLRKAWQNVNNPRSQALAGWLTEDQRNLTPREVDLLSTIYLVDNIRGQRAHTPGLEPFLKWKRGEISTVATHLTARNFIRGAKLEKERWSGSGTSPLIYSLTERALRMLISSDTITGSIHHAMELEIIQEVFTENPPKLYLSVAQIPGEKRCDGIIQTRRDSRAWDQSMTAVNFETPDEVRAHSQLQPEGQVLRNMVEPFAFGAKQLLVVCLEESVPKLEELRATLPTWLAKRVQIKVVKV
jgi:hypothetical protein